MGGVLGCGVSLTRRRRRRRRKDRLPEGLTVRAPDKVVVRCPPPSLGVASRVAWLVCVARVAMGKKSRKSDAPAEDTAPPPPPPDATKAAEAGAEEAAAAPAAGALGSTSTHIHTCSRCPCRRSSAAWLEGLLARGLAIAVVGGAARHLLPAAQGGPLARAPVQRAGRLVAGDARAGIQALP